MQSAIVLNFEHSNFEIVSDFGFRYSDFTSPFSVIETLLNFERRLKNTRGL